jgi:putative ABC transport system permease protein
MIKHYFKQAWNLLRQEKVFSSIYILGTGLSVTVVMALSIVFSSA